MQPHANAAFRVLAAVAFLAPFVGPPSDAGALPPPTRTRSDLGSPPSSAQPLLPSPSTSPPSTPQPAPRRAEASVEPLACGETSGGVDAAVGTADPGRPVLPLEPNAALRFEFPNLPETLAGTSSGKKRPPTLTAVLPPDYTTRRDFPLFVYLLGGPGGRGEEADLALGRSVIGPKGWIVATMPLFKRKLDPAEPSGGLMVSMDDFAVISAAYRTMLERLSAAVPNIDPGKSVFGGHSNGAHTVGVLLAGQDEFIFSRFGSFFLHEGGVGPLFANVLHKRTFRGERFLVMTGGGSERTPAPVSAVALLKLQVERSKLDFTFVTMEGYGHDQPPEYLRVVGNWARGEELDDVPARRKSLADRIDRAPHGPLDSSDWPDMLNADLSNSRHQGWKRSESGVLSAGADALETKSDFGDFALDFEFRGAASLRLGEGGRAAIVEPRNDASAVRPGGEWSRLTAVRKGTRLVVAVDGAAVRELETPEGRVRVGLSGGEDVHYRRLKLAPLR